MSERYYREECGCVEIVDVDARSVSHVPCPAHKEADTGAMMAESCPACDDDGKPCALCNQAFSQPVESTQQPCCGLCADECRLEGAQQNEPNDERLAADIAWLREQADDEREEATIGRRYAERIRSGEIPEPICTEEEAIADAEASDERADFYERIIARLSGGQQSVQEIGLAGPGKFCSVCGLTETALLFHNGVEVGAVHPHAHEFAPDKPAGGQQREPDALTSEWGLGDIGGDRPAVTEIIVTGQRVALSFDGNMIHWAAVGAVEGSGRLQGSETLWRAIREAVQRSQAFETEAQQ